MKIKTSAERLLSLGLFLIALHSLLVGLLLIILGAEAMGYFGFDQEKTFFQTQGGIFHIVMVIAYMIAALRMKENKGLLYFIITAKFIALTYLLVYFFLVENILILLLSGILDGIMGIFVLILLQRLPAEYFSSSKYGQNTQ
jgi:hypothetical protein